MEAISSSETSVDYTLAYTASYYKSYNFARYMLPQRMENVQFNCDVLVVLVSDGSGKYSDLHL
jgi:hypothetical protein